MGVLTDLKARGVEDILVTVTDNLNGFTQTIKSVFPESTTQICVVHQIRNSCKYVVWKEKGEDFWQPALGFEGQVVFLGDYADPYRHCADDGLSTFLEIAAFKRQNPARVTLLLGNHELHYIDRSFRCTRFSEATYSVMHEMLTGSDSALFDVCKRIGDYLFSHAGVLEG